MVRFTPSFSTRSLDLPPRSLAPGRRDRLRLQIGPDRAAHVALRRVLHTGARDKRAPLLAVLVVDVDARPAEPCVDAPRLFIGGEGLNAVECIEERRVTLGLRNIQVGGA